MTTMNMHQLMSITAVAARVESAVTDIDPIGGINIQVEDRDTDVLVTLWSARDGHPIAAFLIDIWAAPGDTGRPRPVILADHPSPDLNALRAAAAGILDTYQPARG